MRGPVTVDKVLHVSKVGVTLCLLLRVIIVIREQFLVLWEPEVRLFDVRAGGVVALAVVVEQAKL